MGTPQAALTRSLQKLVRGTALAMLTFRPLAPRASGEHEANQVCNPHSFILDGCFLSLFCVCAYLGDAKTQKCMAFSNCCFGCFVKR
jgi:hypothetical protein